MHVVHPQIPRVTLLSLGAALLTALVLAVVGLAVGGLGDSPSTSAARAGVSATDRLPQLAASLWPTRLNQLPFTPIVAPWAAATHHDSGR